MDLYLSLFNLSKKMRQSGGGKIIYDILEDAGIRIAVSRFFNRRAVRRDEKHPTERMQNSRIFFRQNQTRVRNIWKMLEDDESREVFKRMIRFRCYSRYEDLPYNSMRKMYFYNEFFDYQQGEVFVDCGAYDGDTIIRFRRLMKKIGSYKIIGFEPDRTNYKNLVRNHPDITAIQAGVWSEDGVLAFAQNGSYSATFLNAENMQSDVKEDNVIKVPVRSLDQVAECKDATFIKMDIEGSEYYALVGARNVICKNKPKLAICMYHSDEDMLRLVELIHEMVPEYRFYIRQHSNSVCETVLYAVY